MNTLKNLQLKFMVAYSWVINDVKNQEGYQEHLTISRVSRQVRLYRSRFMQ